MKTGAAICITLATVCGSIVTALAAKELMYDPDKGIIFIDKYETSVGQKPAGHPVEKAPQRVAERPTKPKSDSDIHVGRKKDPPELYFKSGLEYFKNGDFSSALKNFKFADSVDHRPEYRLWIGKTLRSLGSIDDMLKTMIEIINREPDCDVADDALFELALHYKNTDDYEKSMQLFSQLIEQYPFGLAYSTGEELREIAREQRRLMRAEMINALSILGYIGEDLPASYRKFQQENKLPVTEIGDRQTVKAIKELHRRYIEKEESRAAKKLRLDRYSVWLYGAIAAGVLNTLFLLLLFSKIRTRKRQLAELNTIITDLDVKKL